MAAVGMMFVDGPGTLNAWYGGNSLIPVWMALLPQEHGQTIITASPRGTRKYMRHIHKGVSKERKGYVGRGDAWTRQMCHKILKNATDIAVSQERFVQLTEHERTNLQKFLVQRNALGAKRIEVPNLLNIR